MLKEAVALATEQLKPSSLGVLSRVPLMDDDCPEVPEVDILSVWSGEEELPQRLTVDARGRRVYVDILRVPVSRMIDPAEAAGYRMLPLLLRESEIVWSEVGFLGLLIDRIKSKAYEKVVWEKRLGSQLSFGDSALRESSRNLSYPAGALFFLQTAYAYYMIALADALKSSATSLMTKPLTKLKRMDAVTGLNLSGALVSNLYLEAEPGESVNALTRIHKAVATRYGSHSVAGMSAMTRGHYDYSLSQVELEFRLAVASALINRGDIYNAHFYLRFWAYSLARCPIVLMEATRGLDPTFYVPFRPLRESLAEACPEILEDVTLVLGGGVTRNRVEDGLGAASHFRKQVIKKIIEKGLTPASLRQDLI
jgi:hypothetical protein